MISFLAIAGIFGASSAIVNNEVKETPVVEKAEASVTNGKYRINVLTNSANWLQDNVNTVFNPAGSNVAMSRDTDFTKSSTNSSYSTVTINSTSYNWQTYELTAKTGITKNENYWFGRGNASSNYNWFDSGINLYTQFRNNNWDNTIIISGSWDNFSASGYGWYNKICLHYGKNNASTSYQLVNMGVRPDDPGTPSGYTFSGWYEDLSHTNEWTKAESDAQNNDINLYAKYTANKYGVTISAGTGISSVYLSSSSTATSGSDSGTKFAMDSTVYGFAVLKAGYKAKDGWSLVDGTPDTSGAKYRIGSGTVTTSGYAFGSIAATAQTYTITVNLDDGSGVSSSSYSFKTTAQTVTLGTPTKTGKDFAGYTVATQPTSGTVTVAANGLTLNIPANAYGDFAVTAQWSDGTYTINYNANGGSAAAPASQTPGVGTEVTFATYSGTKTGYTFSGWNTDPTGTGTHYAAGGTGTPTTAKGGTLTLYAEWTINSHTLTWNFGTGATATGYSPAAGSVNYGTAITLPTSISRTGYTHTGYTGYVATMPDSNLTITANWTADTYTIAFNGNGATSGSTASVTATYNATRKLTNNGFAKTGHTFAGWALSEDGAKVYNNGATLTASQVNSHYGTVGKGGTLTLYAKWTVNTYTVTYDRNLGQGSAQATQSKTYGIDVNALTPGQGDLSAQAWNPSQYHYFKHWNTAYDDSDAVIDAGATIGSNEDFTLYYIEDWYEYRYTINGGSPVNMSNQSDTDDVLKQFSPSSAQELPLHGMLQFQVNRHDGNGWVNINVNYESGSNYNTTTGIQLTTIDTIYLKLCSNEVYNVWVPGISERTIKITHGGSGTAYTMKGNGDSECVTVGYVYAQVGDVLEAEYMGGAYKVWLDDGSTGFKNSGATWEASTGVVCTEAGAYTVYLKKGSGEWHNVWISRNEEASAKHFAQLFNSSVGSICTGIQGGTKSLSDLKNVWGATVASGLYKDYSEYSDATKAYFTGGTATEDADILACIAKYNYVINRYGTSQLPNFMGRSDSYKTAVRSFNPFTIMDGESGDNSTTIIIIIAASVSLLSITALSILLVKKRKRVDN